MVKTNSTNITPLDLAFSLFKIGIYSGLFEIVMNLTLHSENQRSLLLLGPLQDNSWAPK